MKTVAATLMMGLALVGCGSDEKQFGTYGPEELVSTERNIKSQVLSQSKTKLGIAPSQYKTFVVSCMPGDKITFHCWIKVEYRENGVCQLVTAKQDAYVNELNEHIRRTSDPSATKVGDPYDC